MKILLERTGPDFLGRMAWKVTVAEGETPIPWSVTVGDEDPPVRHVYSEGDALDIARAAMLKALEEDR